MVLLRGQLFVLRRDFDFLLFLSPVVLPLKKLICTAYSRLSLLLVLPQLDTLFLLRLIVSDDTTGLVSFLRGQPRPVLGLLARRTIRTVWF